MEKENIDSEISQPEEGKRAEETGINSDNADGIASLWDNMLKNRRLARILKSIFITVLSITAALAIFLFIVFVVPLLQEIPSGKKVDITASEDLLKDAAYKKEISQMTKDVQRLSRKYNAYTSGQSYIVINTTDNKFSLYKNKKLIREGFCSTGSLTMLKTESGDKEWVFKTPKGKHSIQGKITHPYWRRPDWSFVEEGLPIPPPNDPSRFEYGVLGDYAMSIGDGYLIHGTLYKRFLGMPVTHGCVRLNDEDLEAIFNALSIGSKVYIF